MTNKISKKQSRVYQLASIGVTSAIICILGPLSIPIGIIPITFTNLAIYIALYALGTKKALISLIIYLLLGFSGLPVFSNFSGGPSSLLGPTGGYLIGFIFMALIGGFFIDRFTDNRYLPALGMIIGTLACYILGSIWLSYQAGIGFKAALSIGVFPFIIGDLAKILLSTYIGKKIRQLLIQLGLFYR